MLRNRTLFISYRRDDSSGWAGRLEADLRSRLGTDVQVFMDVEAIPAGEDFARAIDDAVSRSDALVALIGPGWVTAQDAQGRRRLDDPNDLVRIEIEGALRRGIRVIPVLVGGASLPSPELLPETLRDLTKRQAVRLDHETWNLGLSRLVKAIERRTVFDWVKDLGALAAVLVAMVGLLKRFDPPWFLLLAAGSVLYLLTWSYGVLLAWLRDRGKVLRIVAAALALTAFAAVSIYIYRFEPRPDPDRGVTITDPKSGDSVTRQERVTGTSRALRPKTKVWLVVEHKFSRTFHPQNPAEVRDGGWEALATVGAPQRPTNNVFIIHAIVGEDNCLDNIFQTYLDVANAAKKFPGIRQLPETGIAVEDAVEVRRVE